MIIRPGQMLAFSASRRRWFEGRMVDSMRARPRAINMSESELQERTLNIIELAEKHGIDREQDVHRFLELVFDRVPHVLNDPQVMAALTANGLQSPVKLAFVADVLSSRDS